MSKAMASLMNHVLQPWTFVGDGAGFGQIYYVGLVDVAASEVIAISESSAWMGNVEDFLIEFRKLNTK